MKKLLVLGLILALSTAATALTVSFEAATPPVGEHQGIPSYVGSQWIEIVMVADFEVSNLLLHSSSDGGSVSSPAGIHTALQGGSYSGGTVKNTNGILLLGVEGAVSIDATSGVAPGESLITFLFHVPELEESTIITIDDYIGPNPFFPPTPPPTLETSVGQFGTTEKVTDIVPLEIHITPEPMTVALLGLGGLFLRRRK